MSIHLAPMEGLVDPIMRLLLTEIGGLDECVTEFVRVTDALLPLKVYRRICPELDAGFRTPAGTPVHVQFLGSNPDSLAANAARIARQGAPTIDLNFGCPAKTVNRHRGGAVLLEEPETLYRLVQAVRSAVPETVPVTAKMRLGYTDKAQSLACAAALEAGGASRITVHARTKTDGYRPPAYWPWIARVREQVRIPVVANGEVWTLEDYHRCREESGCDTVMLGRGRVARPDLARQIRQAQAGESVHAMTWSELYPLLDRFYAHLLQHFERKHMPGRLKQWLTYLRLSYPEADRLWSRVRREKDPVVLAGLLAESADQCGDQARQRAADLIAGAPV